jgi:hypothetical protein
MADQPTCGEGLAEYSSLPAKLAELTAAVAANLDVHMRALDLGDENASREHEVYVKLAHEHRAIAAHLEATADELAGYRDLPMGRHDEEAMSSPAAVEALKRLVDVEQDLLALLQQRLEHDRKILGAVSGDASV